MQLRRVRRAASADRPGAPAPGGDRARRRYRAARSHRAIAGPARDLARPLGGLCRRSRDAPPRQGGLRRALRLVPEVDSQSRMSWRLFPEGIPPAARTLLIGRGLRAFADGFVSLLLPAYLIALGFGPLEVGVLATATLLGSAALTLWVGMAAQRFGRQELLVAAALLMILTGAGFLIETDYWPLLAIAFVGTLNPSSGDVSVFLPLEQALMAESVEDRHRPGVFAAYRPLGSLVAALGALAAGLSALLPARPSTLSADALRGMSPGYL